MGLRHIIPVLALLIQLQGLTEAQSSYSALPLLWGNKLAEGADKYLPNSQAIQCGRPEINTGKLKQIRRLPQAVSYFSSYAFTADPIGFQGVGIESNIGKFTIAELKGKRYVYALQMDPSSELAESAYWLPQGGFIDVPFNPSSNEPKFVLTPDFSGSSWTVTPLANGNLRLRHVDDGKEAVQFNNLSEAEKGGPKSYAMQYKDYGYLTGASGVVGNIEAFAYMHYSEASWSFHFQRKTCASVTGAYQFQDNLLSSAAMIDTIRNRYNPVTGTEDCYIP